MKYFNYDKQENVVKYQTEVCTYYKDPTDYDTIPHELEIDWEDFWEECEDIVNTYFPIGAWEEEPKTSEEKIAFIENVEKQEHTKEFQTMISVFEEKAQEEWEDEKNSYYEEPEEPDWDYLERTIWWDHE